MANSAKLAKFSHFHDQHLCVQAEIVYMLPEERNR